MLKKYLNNNKIYICLLCVIIFFAFFMLNFFVIENDYFWHIKAGEYMYNNHILKYDIFSWFVSGKYWMSHEWLFEILLYSLKIIFPYSHVIIYSLISLVVLLFILFIPNKNGIVKNIPYTLIYLVFFFILSMNYIQARPHLFSFSLLALTIYFLYDLYNDENSKKIFFLPLISIFWANFHGGSSNLPYIFCFLFLVGGLFSFSYKKIEAKRLNKLQLKKYLLVMVLCMLAVCINIHGIKMFFYPYANMLDSTMLNNISEWQSTSLNNWFHYFYFLFLILVVFTFLFSDKKIRFIDFLIFAFAMYLGLKSIRFWFYTYICVSYFIFDYVSKRKKIDKGTELSLIILSIFLLGMFILNSHDIFNIKYELNINKKLVSIINKEKPKRLFNMYDYGGELIYNNIDVFIDGRADLYTKYNFKDYLNISNLHGDYVDLINKYNFDYYLVKKDSPIEVYLRYDSGCLVIYKDKKLILYKKTA